MADPAEIDIIADRRVDYDEEFTFLEVDYTGSNFKMQVRAVKDTTGTPPLDISTGTGNFSIFYAGTDTVANHIAAGRLSEAPDGYDAADSLTLSVVHIGIAGFVIDDIPTGIETGDDWHGFYDIIRTPVSGSAEIIMRGAFTVRAGVTIP